MYCPNCATQADSKQKFCRQCGQDLNMVEQVLKGQKAVKAGNRAAAISGLALCLSGAALVSVLNVLSEKGINLGGAFMPYLMAAAVVMAIGGLGAMMYAFIPAMNIQRLSSPVSTTGKLSHTQPDLLTDAPPTITEHTTKILEEENR
jgi:hypothetical protein